ncbi:MAG: hypothetical protein ACREDZ_10550 [Kiloniellales bacterium]
MTPGSSLAGFGIREAALIMVIQGSLDREAGMLIALAMRLVTIAGDLMFFCDISRAAASPRALVSLLCNSRSTGIKVNLQHLLLVNIDTSCLSAKKQRAVPTLYFLLMNSRQSRRVASISWGNVP